jgi:hypothetical protein
MTMDIHTLGWGDKVRTVDGPIVEVLKGQKMVSGYSSHI